MYSIVIPDVRIARKPTVFGSDPYDPGPIRRRSHAVIMGPGSLTFLSKFDPRVRGDKDLEESRGRDDTERVPIESGPLGRDAIKCRVLVITYCSI